MWFLLSGYFTLCAVIALDLWGTEVNTRGVVTMPAQICVFCREHTDNVLTINTPEIPSMTADFWVCGKCLNFERLQELESCALNACRLKLMSN